MNPLVYDRSTTIICLFDFRRLYEYHLPRVESRDGVSIYKMTNQAPLGSMIRSMFDLPHQGSAPWCFEKQMVPFTTNMAYFYPCWKFLDIHGDFLLMLRPGRERRLPNLESLFIMGVMLPLPKLLLSLSVPKPRELIIPLLIEGNLVLLYEHQSLKPPGFPCLQSLTDFAVSLASGRFPSLTTCSAQQQE